MESGERTPAANNLNYLQPIGRGDDRRPSQFRSISGLSTKPIIIKQLVRGGGTTCHRNRPPKYAPKLFLFKYLMEPRGRPLRLDALPHISRALQPVSQLIIIPYQIFIRIYILQRDGNALKVIAAAFSSQLGQGKDGILQCVIHAIFSVDRTARRE